MFILVKKQNIIPKLLALSISYLIIKTPVHAQVVLNEISPRTDPEWVELYNNSDLPIDLQDWTIRDGNSKTSDDLILTGTISARATLVFTAQKGWLNDSGTETVSLSNETGSLIDSYTYTDPPLDYTICRLPDGVGSFVVDCIPTQNSTNILSSPSPSPSPSPSTPSPSPSPQNPTTTPSPISSPSFPSSPSSPTPPQNSPVSFSSIPPNSPTIALLDFGIVPEESPLPKIASPTSLTITNPPPTHLSPLFLGLGLFMLGLGPLLYFWLSHTTQI